MAQGHELNSCGILARSGWYDMDPKILERIDRNG